MRFVPGRLVFFRRMAVVSWLAVLHFSGGGCDSGRIRPPATETVSRISETEDVSAEAGRAFESANERVLRAPASAASYLERARADLNLAYFITPLEQSGWVRAALLDLETANQLEGGRWPLSFSWPTLTDAMLSGLAGERPARLPVDSQPARAGSAEALREAGMILLCLQWPERARVFFEHAAVSAPEAVATRDLAPLLSALQREVGWWELVCHSGSSSEPLTTFEAAVSRGYAASQVENWEVAVSAYEQALRHRPDAIWLHWLLFDALFGAGQFERILAICPEHEPLTEQELFRANNVAAIEWASGFPHLKRFALQALQRREPGFPMGWLNLGRSERTFGRHDRANYAFAQAESLVPQLADAVAGRAFNEFARRNYAVAAAEYGKAIEKLAEEKPRERDRAMKAEAEIAMGALDTAERTLALATARDQPDDVALVLHAAVLDELKREDEAEEMTGRAESWLANDRERLLEAGRHCRDAQMFARGAAYFRRANAIRSDGVSVGGLRYCLANGEHGPETLAELQQLAHVHTEDLGLISSAAIVAGFLEQWEAADSLFDRLEQLQGRNDFATAYRALNDVRRGRAVDGDAFARLIRADPDFNFWAVQLWSLENRRSETRLLVTRILACAKLTANKRKQYELMLGRVTAEELLASAASATERCESHYTLAEMCRFNDDLAGAAAHFRECRATGQSREVEYQHAGRMLRSLEAAGKMSP